jgi:hypothetical protein
MSSIEHHSQEHSKETKYTKEQHTLSQEHKYTSEDKMATHQAKTVVVQRVQNEPVVIERHHHHTHTVIHPEIVREHNTTEIRQVVQPLYEHLSGESVEYAGKEVKVVEKTEDVTEAQMKLEAHKREIQAKADITHTKDKTISIDQTKEKDIHAAHKVIEEVTPVIIRDVDHKKTIHKDEKVVEKIHHAPQVIKEEKEIIQKEAFTKEVKSQDTTTTGFKTHKDEVPVYGHVAKPDH